MSFYSIATWTGDGVTTSFSVPFPYINQSHVLVSVGGEAVAYSFTSPSQITFSVAPANGAAVSFQRKTPSDDLLAYIQGKSVLKSKELNLVYTQLLYIMQEVFDVGAGLEDSTIEVGAALAEIIAALAEIRVVASAIAYQYDAIVSVPYNPQVDDTVAHFPVVRPLLLEQDAPGSEADALYPPSSLPAVVSIRKNDVEVGTVTFLAGSSDGTFNVPADVTFVAGDTISYVVTSADLTFRHFGITTKHKRTA